MPTALYIIKLYFEKTFLYTHTKFGANTPLCMMDSDVLPMSLYVSKG